jgi:hypothetical protein
MTLLVSPLSKSGYLRRANKKRELSTKNPVEKVLILNDISNISPVSL